MGWKEELQLCRWVSRGVEENEKNEVVMRRKSEWQMKGKGTCTFQAIFHPRLFTYIFARPFLQYCCHALRDSEGRPCQEQKAEKHCRCCLADLDVLRVTVRVVAE